MSINIYLCEPINKTAAIVVSQSGCSDELTPVQKRDNIVSRMKQIDNQIEILSKTMTKKNPARKKLGLEKFQLCHDLKEIKLKIKEINIKEATRKDFYDCVFESMKENLSTFKYKQIMSLAESMYSKSLINT
jgi:hypothetical protein